MLRNLFYLLLIAAAVLYLPWWWLTLTALALSVIVVRPPYLVFLPALLFDWLYGLPTGALSSFLGAMVAATAISLMIFGQKLIRFN